MNKNLKLLANVVLSAVILTVGFIGLKIFGQKPDIPKDIDNRGPRAPKVQTAEVTAWQTPIALQVDGEASAYRIVTIGTEVEGRVTYKSPTARSGTSVREGDILFRIDDSTYTLELRRLRAQLQQVKEELNAVVIDLNNTADLVKLAEEDVALQAKHLRRMQQLAGRNTANQKEVDDAIKQDLEARKSLKTLENQRDTLKQQQKTKQADILLVKTQIRRAQLDLERCEVRSKLDGRIVDDLVEIGDFLRPGDDLVHISDSSRMEVRCQLSRDELAWVWRQHKVARPRPEGFPTGAPDDPLTLPYVPCQVSYEFQGTTTVWDGYISRFEGSGMDRETRMFPCRVLVESPHEGRVLQTEGGANQQKRLPTLLSGLYVSVNLKLEAREGELLQLPLEAIRPGGKAWRYNEEAAKGSLQVVDLVQAHVEGNSVIVYANETPLEAGDTVIVSPLAAIQDGMAVEAAASKEAAE